MKNGVMDTTSTTKEIEIVPSSAILPVNKIAVQELQTQRALLADFVRSQLVEASFDDSRSASYGEGDFGIIPGTKKRCLFKSGAEKLLRLFGLGARFTQTDKEFDRTNNFAMYTYKAEVYAIRSGNVLAECEATANSQEIKYKEKTEWKTNDKGARISSKVETPICDIINTLQKMAQKRALIGATLLATGASEYFTQDVLEDDSIAVPQNQQQAQKEEPAQQKADGEVPFCCNKEMSISKYQDKATGSYPYYCFTCKRKEFV